VLIFSITLVKLQGKAFAEKQRVREWVFNWRESS
jgi:hypothetical protein